MLQEIVSAYHMKIALRGRPTQGCGPVSRTGTWRESRLPAALNHHDRRIVPLGAGLSGVVQWLPVTSRNGQEQQHRSGNTRRHTADHADHHRHRFGTHLLAYYDSQRDRKNDR
jgi:hypothetical protein